MSVTILCMAGLGRLGAKRPVFAIAEHFDGIADPECSEESTDLLRPFFSQGQVILTTTSLIGMSFDSKDRGGVLLENFRLRREGPLGLLRKVPFVEFEVHVLELFQQVLRRD